MWTWLVVGYALMIFMLAGSAGFVALFVSDRERRKVAYDVLKLVLTTGSGSAGIVAVAMKLHQAGLW